MSTGSQAEDRTCLLGAGALVIRAPWLFQASVLTIVWNDGPGHGRRIDAPGHPENAQPTEMLPSLLPRQELREIGENNGQRSADTAERERKKGQECENQATQSKRSQQKPSCLDPAVGSVVKPPSEFERWSKEVAGCIDRLRYTVGQPNPFRYGVLGVRQTSSPRFVWR